MQVTPPRIRINVVNKKKMKYLEELTGTWSQKHVKPTIDNLAPVDSNSAEGRYESLKQIFVELPEKAFPLRKEKAECYDCAWLSLTALSTVTRNLWL
jgi:hypothetical protein